MQGWSLSNLFTAPQCTAPDVKVEVEKVENVTDIDGNIPRRHEDVRQISDTSLVSNLEEEENGDLNQEFSAALKRTTAMLRSLIESQEARLSDRINEVTEKCTRHEGVITDLMDRIEDNAKGIKTNSEGVRTNRESIRTARSENSDLSGLGFSPESGDEQRQAAAEAAFTGDHASLEIIKDDVQLVIDAMRVELGSVRVIVDEIKAKTAHVSSSQHNHDIAQAEINRVRLAECVENVSELERKVQAMEEEIKAVKDDQEYSSIQAGYLAIAASECAHDDKDQMFQSLRTKEEAYHRKRVHQRASLRRSSQHDEEGNDAQEGVGSVQVGRAATTRLNDMPLAITSG